MKATNAKPSRAIYKTDLEQREELDAEVKRLRRQASDLSKQLADLDAAIAAYVRHHRKPGQPTLVRSGFLLGFAKKRKSCSWKALFLRACGRHAVDEAEAEAGTTEVLTVERAK
ncbi:MAG: hypothetical protein AAF790_15295 [Planctomycetota bacterium]